MGKEFKPLSWLVTNFDCNTQTIKYYDVLRYREDYIKQMKKKCATKEEFAQKLQIEMMYHYWSRAEYELIIEKYEDGHIWLIPWCGCYHPEQTKIDVAERTDFDWRGFAEQHIDERYGNDAKIDIYDQLMYRFDEFVDYTWNYRHKWQRKNLGGARRDGD